MRTKTRTRWRDFQLFLVCGATRPRKSDKELTERVKVLSATYGKYTSPYADMKPGKVWRLVPFLNKIEYDFHSKTAHP